MNNFNFFKKNKIIILTVIVLTTFIAFGLYEKVKPVFPEQKQIALIYPHTEEHTYWKNYSIAMAVATKNLGLKFKPYYSGLNIMKTIRTINKVITTSKPDAIAICTINSKKGSYSIKSINRKKIPFLIIDRRFTPEEYIKYRLGEDKYLIGQLYPNDFEAGYTLAIELAKKARPAKDGYIHMLALEGHTTSTNTIDRRNGLKKSTC